MNSLPDRQLGFAMPLMFVVVAVFGAGIAVLERSDSMTHGERSVAEQIEIDPEREPKYAELGWNTDRNESE